MATVMESTSTPAGFKGHVLLVTDDELRAILARPAAFYVVERSCLDGPHRQAPLPPEHVIFSAGKDRTHWLLSGEVPGVQPDGTVPLAFLDRGGTEVEVDTKFTLGEGREWICRSARCFGLEDERAIRAAVTRLDEAALRRKGGEDCVGEWKDLRQLLEREEAGHPMFVAGNVCFRMSLAQLPVFRPSYLEREKKRAEHVSGQLPPALRTGGMPVGGEPFIGFGQGPARAFLSTELEALDLAGADASLIKKWRLAMSQKRGLLAYERMSLDEVHGEAAELFRTGYYGPDEIVEILDENHTAPLERIQLAVKVEGEIAALQRSTWPDITDCDRLFRAFDRLRGTGFVVLERTGAEVSEGYEVVGETVIEGKAAGPRSFCFFYGQALDRAIEVRVFWQCRPRSEARALL
jgi:hypothetical protein